MVTIIFFCFVLFSSLDEIVHGCNQVDHDSLLAFYNNIGSAAAPPLNWSQSTNCCEWEGVACTTLHGIARVTHLWLPEKHLSGTITPSLANLSSLSHLNLSHNLLSGPLPLLHSLQTLDLSFNHLSGPLPALPTPIRSLDISSNLFNASIDSLFLHRPALNLISFNISNNSFTGGIPSSSVCKSSPLLKMLDFSMNRLTGGIAPGFGECRDLQVFRAGSNSLSGFLPNDLYEVTSLKEISLSRNQFTGPISNTIGMLSNLTILELHVNELTGELPPEIGFLSNLEQLHLYGNGLNGTLPPSLMECSNLRILFLRNNHFGGEISNLNFSKLQRIEAVDLTLGGCKLKGPIPFWLAKLTKLRLLDLSRNQFYGPVPSWFGTMPSLFSLNLTQNHLSGDFPRELGRMQGLITDNTSMELIYLALPYVANGLQYNRLLNIRQALALGDNALSGEIPEEIGRLKLVQVLDLSNNVFDGSIPEELGRLRNLEALNLSGNHLRGEIPESLAQLSFLSSFSVADNDLGGVIPRGGQFDTFSAESFQGNPGLCGGVLNRSCPVPAGVDTTSDEEDVRQISWFNVFFGLGYSIGFSAVVVVFWLKGS